MRDPLRNVLASLVHRLFPSAGGLIAVGLLGLLMTMFLTGHVPADALRTWSRPAAAVLMFSGLMVAFGVVRLRRAVVRPLVEERRGRSMASVKRGRR